MYFSVARLIRVYPQKFDIFIIIYYEFRFFFSFRSSHSYLYDFYTLFFIHIHNVIIISFISYQQEVLEARIAELEDALARLQVQVNNVSFSFQ
jgi:hypothetical protein